MATYAGPSVGDDRVELGAHQIVVGTHEVDELAAADRFGRSR
jgi:hypothetical protein